MWKILDFFKTTITVFLFILIIIWIPMVIVFWADYVVWSYRCSHSYDDTKYDLLLWCKVNYKWKYILEKLYIKTFEQNININEK